MKKLFLLILTFLVLVSSGCDKTSNNSGISKNLSTSNVYKSISLGDSFALRLDKNGKLTVSSEMASVKLFPDKVFTCIDALGESAVAVDSNGKFYVWENGLFSMNTPKPLDISKMETTATFPLDESIKDVSIGASHITAVTKNGNVYTFGNNNYSQLGLDPKYSESIISKPSLVDGLKNIVKVSNGYLSTIAISNDGRVFAWGEFDTPIYNDMSVSSQIALPTQISLTEKIIDADSGFFFDLLLSDKGIVYGRGRNENGQSFPSGAIYTDTFSMIKLPEKIVKVKANVDYAIALSETGKVFVWGSNDYGQLGIAPSYSVMPTRLPLENIKEIATGPQRSVFVSDKAIFISGQNIKNEFDGAKTLEEYKHQQTGTSRSIKQISSGYSMSAAINADRQLLVWGTSWKGSLGNKSVYDIPKPKFLFINDILCSKVDTQFGVTTVLLENGDIYNFGSNSNGRLGLGHHLNMWKPAKVDLPGKVVNFFAGTNATIAQLESGDWYAWGDNSYGSLLTEDKAPHETPIKINLPYSIKIISSHATHTLLLNSNGTVYQYGNLFNDEDIVQPFTKIHIPEAVISIATTYKACYALGKSGILYAWGDNTDSHIGLSKPKVVESPEIIPISDTVVQISVSPILGMATALTKHGKVYTWGYNVLRVGGEKEILEVPTAIDIKDKISLVFSGDLTAYAVNSLGDIYTWGGVINNEHKMPQRSPIRFPYQFEH